MRTARTMPQQRPATSRQDYGTPWDFIRAAEARFGKLDVDLAARRDNAKARRFISPRRNALHVEWSVEYCGALAWLNPEFADIEPWAAKCARERKLRILLLTPASVGSNWFVEHVHRRALVLALNPRLVFVGERDPYPKDCILSCFGFGRAGFDVWRWK